jgi:1-deoxy-D-xylulose-5-phosphate reductoisomerase
MRRLTILGSTGSIGVSTLDVVARNPDDFDVLALTARSRLDLLHEQCLRFRPRYAVIAGETDVTDLQGRLQAAGCPTEVLCGIQALEQVAALPEIDTVMAAIVGIAGLRPTLAAARAGKRVLLANKEALVTAGGVFMAAVRESGAELLPIDSEHNAIFQCLPQAGSGGMASSGVRRILLTASGGPFRATPLARLAAVTPEQAVAHPNWSMGRKISVDSATMMNKGLEVIEAHWLFGAPPGMIEVVVHPQSVVHSLVEYEDGSVLAQLGNPDMRTPIAHALAYPRRMPSGAAFLDLAAVGQLQFEAVDNGRFPCLPLAYEALRSGPASVIALNAANEVAVEAFLDRRIGYLDIAAVIESVLGRCTCTAVSGLEDVERCDAQARRLAWEEVSVRRPAGAMS